MKKGILFVICLFLLFLPFPVFAAGETGQAITQETIEEAEQEALLKEFDKLDTEAVDRAAGESEVGFSALLRQILTGEFDFTFSGMQEATAEAAFREVRTQGRLLLQLVLVVVLSAVLKQLSDSLQGKSAGEMGFSICYMVLVVLLLETFYEISACVVERMEGLCSVYGAMLPLFLILSASSGNLTQSSLLAPTIMGGLGGLS